MKTNKIFFLILAFAFLSCQLSAQIKVKSIGLNLGYYEPELDYWNDVALSTWDDQFSGGFNGLVNLEVNVVTPVSVRFNVGYWSQEVEQPGIEFGDVSRTDRISIQLIPITLDAIARTNVLLPSLEIFGGAGAGTNFVSQNYEREIPDMGTTEDKSNGRDFITYVLGGVDYNVLSNLALGMEFRYNWADYEQKINNNQGSVDVKIDGPQILFTLKYLY
ncbi:MAG: outer membrane beta-barrel protein [Ignavibacteria bacterium]|jgi:opacity protein-like surface antigen